MTSASVTSFAVAQIVAVLMLYIRFSTERWRFFEANPNALQKYDSATIGMVHALVRRSGKRNNASTQGDGGLPVVVGLGERRTLEERRRLWTDGFLSSEGRNPGDAQAATQGYRKPV